MNSAVSVVESQIHSDFRFRYRPMIKVSQEEQKIILTGCVASYYEKSLVSEAAKKGLQSVEKSEFLIDNQVQIAENRENCDLQRENGQYNS